MEIREITDSYKMSITISNQRSNVTLNSNIVFVQNNKLYVEPFEHNGVILNFDSDGIAISMIAYQEEKVPFLWQIVRVHREIVDGTQYHVITSDVPGVRINRRDNFRVFLGIDGKASIPGKTKPFDVVVKDISESGFAILLDITSEIKIPKNELVLLEFYDSIGGVPFVLNGRVVRINAMDKYTLYGCRLIKDNPLVSRFIANKQLETRLNKTKKQV